MKRTEENNMIINKIIEGAKEQPTETYNDAIIFQLTVISTMLTDISKSLAIIADRGSEDA